MIGEWSNRILMDWDMLPKFQAMFTENLTSGLITLLLIVGGFILALVFEKKFGWILVLGGIGYLLHILGFF